MSYLPSLPEDAKLLDVFRAFPGTAHPLIDYHEALMRGDSPLTEAERELIAAYVSGLNACTYCFSIHQTTAQTFGVDAALLEHLLTDLDSAPVEDGLRTLLAYLGKVTTDPARVTPTDARRVLDAGWSEHALHDAVSVCALFNFMNRFVNGLGITAGKDYYSLSGNRLAEHGYAGLKNLL